MIWDVIVIGGGPAGMMAAGTAAITGCKVLLIERNEKLGKKLYITGKGRCNVTNASDIDNFMQNIPKNSKFLYSSLHAFGSKDLISHLENLGVKLKVEHGARVFPESDKSSDIIKALEKYLRNNNVEILLNERVKEAIVEDKKIKGVLLYSGKIIDCKNLIIAAGGKSYPQTGSTGDGYSIAAALGHHVTDIEPSLVPVETRENWVKDLQGLSLRNVNLSVYFNEKKVAEEFGEMLFTHFGISGPIVLTLSAFIKDYLKQKGKIFLSLDLKPTLNIAALDKRLQRDFEKYSKKRFKNSLNDLLPVNLIPKIISLSGIDEDKPVNQITKEERLRLADILKGVKLTIKKLRPIDEAIITSGGISVKEIDSSTMQSKLIRGLYFAGETIDVDAVTGGYNLQIAFSTGYLAGKSAAHVFI